MKWNPDRYLQFQAERFAPFRDVAALIDVRPGMRAIDLGCGTGELTAKLHGMLPDSRVTGIDSSEDMLGKAQALANENLTFEQRAIEDVSGEYDLVFSHAALQWVPDHERLIRRIWPMAAPGGQLAVQVPSNHHHNAFVIYRELACDDPFAQALTGNEEAPAVLPIEAYARMLFDLEAENAVVFEKVYPHILENADAIADWISGTALLPTLNALGEELAAEFMTQYRKRLRDAYPESPVYYPFRRTIFYGRKADTA